MKQLIVVLFCLFVLNAFADNSLLDAIQNPPPPIKGSTNQNVSVKNTKLSNQELANRHNDCLKQTNNIGECQRQYNNLKTNGQPSFDYSFK